MQLLRTPEERFAVVPGFRYRPVFVEVGREGGEVLRVAVIDEGPVGAPVVVMLHTAPAWSFTWRAVIPAVLALGFRVVVPDLVGFGRSDKPVERAAHTRGNHVRWLRATLEARGVRSAVLVAQGWGVTLGLSLLREQPGLWTQIVAVSLWLPTGDVPLPQSIVDWRGFAATAPVLPVGAVIAAGSWRGLAPEVVAAYDAPFVEDRFTAGPRAFPAMLPVAAGDEHAVGNVRALHALVAFTGPVTTIAGDGDGVSGPALTMGRSRHHRIERAGYWVVDDAGDEVADVVVDALG